MSQRTPFFERHVSAGGKIVDFHGWELPVQYSTITQEHNAVRTKAGVFDISHMGQVFFWGPEAEPFLQKMITNDLSKAALGRGLYAHLLNEKGGVIDDIFVYRVDEERFLMVINASRREADIAWMESHRPKDGSVEMMEAPFGAAFALQGPEAVAIAAKLSPGIANLPRFHIGEFEIGDISVLVARTGYTGEDGVEFFAPAGHLLIVWDLLMKAGASQGLIPCGLGARDTLRTEAAYPLYGNELDEEHTPLEAGLEWVVKWTKNDFLGRAALEKQKKAGLTRKLIGFRVEAGGVARHGATVTENGKDIGVVTSGTFSPTLNMAIGMAYVPVSVASEGVKLTLKSGAREFQAVTVKLPFYKRPTAVPSA